jgi:PKD repeat protein
MIKTITSKTLFKLLGLGGALMLSATSLNAQISLAALNVAYTQDFNTLQSSGTGHTIAIPDWSIFEQGTSATVNQFYNTGTGSSGTGDTYSFGSASNSERALGGISSGTFVSTFGAFFVNNTGATVNTLSINYIGEQWRSGDATSNPDSLVFQYSLDATDLTTASGTWVFVSPLNFKAPINNVNASALDGNAVGNFSLINSVITGLNIPNGSTFRIRWTDPNTAGTDDGLAIDDFSITPMFVNELSISDVTMNEGNAGSTPFDFVVQLTAPAGVGGVSFELTSADLTANQPGDYMEIPTTFGTIPQGATSYTLTVPVYGDVTIESDETFSINVTNVVGATVTDAMAIGTIVNDDYITPVVTLDPSDVTICSGSIANFFVAASGTPTPTVQWQVSTNGGVNWSDMPGQITTNLQFPTQSTDNGSIYRAIFSNGGADTTASAAIFVQPNYFINEAASVCPGGNYTFPDGTTETNVTAQIVHVSNLVTMGLGCDSVITTTLDVNPVYNITENASVCIGGDFTYPDGTTNTNITVNESHVSNLQTLLGCDSIVTTNLTVNTIFPQITANSGNVVVCGDVSADFGIVVNGTNNTYQWFFDEVGGSDFGLINGTYGESNFDTDTMTVQQLITNNYNGYYVYCEVTNEFGCTTRSDNDTIVANDLPTASYSSVVNAASVDFTDSSVDAVSFEWSFGDGNTTTLQSPSHTYAANGTYTVCLSVTSINGCVDSVCSFVTIQGISINELNSAIAVNVFPNPAHNKLSIEFAAEINVAKVSMVNMIGQVVLTESLNSKTRKIDLNLTSIETGVYYLLIENGTERTVKKVIVE